MEKSVKITKKVVLGALKEYFNQGNVELSNDVVTLENVIAYIDNELVQLEKKSSNRKVNSSTRNDEVRAVLLSALSKATEPITISQLLKFDEVKEFTYTDGKDVKNISASKATSVLTPLTKTGEVKREEVKGKALFSYNA